LSTWSTPLSSTMLASAGALQTGQEVVHVGALHLDVGVAACDQDRRVRSDAGGQERRIAAVCLYQIPGVGR
jgi:hypothetical protein